MLARILVTTRVVMSHTFTVDEVATDATTDVTATLSRLDGTIVDTQTADHPGTGRYDYPVPASTLLDAQRLAWSGSVAGAPVVVTDLIEHVGGFIFDLGVARSTLSQAQRYTGAQLAAKRIGVEIEAELIAGRAFVPRFARYLLDGSGTSELVCPDMDLRAVRAVKVADRYGAALVALSVEELAAVAPTPEGVLIRDDGQVWPDGRRNVLVEYEHGLDAAPATVTEAAIQRLRYTLSQGKTLVADRAISYTVIDGGVYRMAQAGKHSTGVPDIDAAYRNSGHPDYWMASR